MEVKQTIREQTPGGLNKKDYLTVLGFFRLHHLFIEKGKWETPWKVLRRFHYDDELELEEAFLCPELDLNDDQTIELNAEGDRFFRELFKSFDKDQDGALSPAELSRLFETSPGQPWDEKFPKWTTATDAHGYVNLQGFLSQWNMTTLLDYKVTLRYLAYLGYEDVSETGDARDDTTRAISIMQGRKADLKAKRTDRTVFQCFVFGAPRSGKSTFLNGLINAPYSDTYSPTMESRSVVNMVINERYLVLREFSDENQAILSEDLMKTCDLACLLYDGHDPNSFSYAAKIQQQLGKRVPIMFVCTKSDLALVKQNHPITPEQLCESLRIPLPKAVSFVKRAEDPAEIYQALQQRIMMTYENGGSHIWLVIVGIGLAAGIIAGGVYYRSKR
jgi:Ras family protein T1